MAYGVDSKAITGYWLLVTASSLLTRITRGERMLDLILRNGEIVDGTGRPRFRADVGIVGDRVEAVGALGPCARARRTVDATGLVIAPGFIDLHGHSDLVFTLPGSEQARLLEGRIRQGITTEVIGNCGLGAAPVNERSRSRVRALMDFLSPNDAAWTWTSVGSYLDRLEANGTALNVCALVPHGPLRFSGTEAADAAPSEERFRVMEWTLTRSLEEGALGLSFGLIYPPGQFAPTEELIRLCRVVARYDGLAAFHQRGGGPETLFESVQELIRVGREAAVSVEHSHEQIHGRGDWSAIWRTVEAKDRARREGVDIGQDLFPYTSVCTTMAALYPPWALSEGMAGLLTRLRDPSQRTRIAGEIERSVPSWPPWNPGGWPVNIVRDFGWENIYVAFVPGQVNTQFEGKSLCEIGAATGKSPFDAVCDLMIEEGGTLTQLIFGISGDRTTDAPLRELMVHSETAFITDAWEIGRGAPHPGAYGAYPRVLGRYVREFHVLPLEEAVRKMTSLPARRLRLKGRGVLREGAFADLVVFDPERVQDRATHECPREFAEGVPFVIVNGRVVVESGEYAGEMVGRVLRR